MNWLAWSQFLAGRPAFRQRQLEQAVFQQLVTDWSAVTTLSAADRQWLTDNCPLDIKARIFGQDNDQAQKAQIIFSDGQRVETVLMRHGNGRRTVCLSSQVGCPLGCQFCSTGQQGFQRNLSSGEIVEQALLWQRLLAVTGQRIDNLVFMGMGEPLLNLAAVLTATEWLHRSNGFNIGWRHIAISTVGLVPELKQLTKYGQQIKLAWSLHAANDQLRRRLMPINRRYALAAVKQAFLNYAQVANRRVMVEYLLLDQVNDSLVQAEELADFLADFPKNLLVINLLTYNPGAGQFRPSQAKVRRHFANILQRHGYKVTERNSLGQEVIGACGQLAG
jgi:23S rRNA (adenine2503-C2)-methyltransferase